MKSRNGFVSNSSSSSFVILIKDVALRSLIDGKEVLGVKLDRWESMLLECTFLSKHVSKKIILGDIVRISGSTMDGDCPEYPELCPVLRDEFKKEFMSEMHEWEMDAQGICFHWDNNVWRSLQSKLNENTCISLFEMEDDTY